MLLTELEPEFIRREVRPCAGYGKDPECNVVSPHTEHEWWLPCELPSADGVQFLCPVCFVANGGAVGTHSIVCWRPRVPVGVEPGPGRWEFQGTGLADLTLVAGSSSVALRGGCAAHFHIRDGAIFQ
jgi:hypothetical protein